MHNQNDDIAKYALLTQAILGDPQLSSTDKIVLGRISGFAKFYESASSTAEFCGLSERQVQESKRKLEKLGYIVTIANTGRGKAYRTAPDYLWMDSRLTKKCTSTENCRADLQKNVSQTYRKLDTENKERINKEENNKGASAPADAIKTEKAEEYGNHDVNDFLKRWCEASGNDCSKLKRERNASYNLIRSNTQEGLDAIIQALDDIRTSGDPYAPQIAKPSDLVGQYSKLPKLRAWVARQAEKIPQPSGPVLSGFPAWLWDEHQKSDEEIEAIKKVADEWRKKLPFMKNKGEGK